MKTQNVKVQIGGRSSPPADLREAAKKTLGNRFEAFIEKYGDDFTPQELVKYSENE